MRCHPGFALGVSTLLLGLLAGAAENEAPPSRRRGDVVASVRSPTGTTPALATPWRARLPPPPKGCTDLAFEEIFAPPGRLGLEYSEKARDLDGHRVRLTGWMTRQERRTPGTFLFAGSPTTVAESHYSLAEDLPPSAVHVHVPTQKFSFIPWIRGPLVLTGTLSLGGRDEPSGRRSWVRLTLDQPLDVAAKASGELFAEGKPTSASHVSQPRADAGTGASTASRSDGGAETVDAARRVNHVSKPTTTQTP